MTPAAEQVLALRRAAQPRSTETLDRLGVFYRVEPLIAALVLLALSPLMLAVALTILLLARRSPLVRHRRVGWRGVDLPMLKFRSMWEPKQKWGPVFAIEDVSRAIPIDKAEGDDRITSRFASLCRRFSIDELPQLYHVLRAEMSLVGPRPITQAEIDEHYGDSAEAVLSLRPGLTGLWQMKGRSRLTYAQRRRLDVWLAKHASPGLYLWILFSSIPIVLGGDDAY